MKVDSCYIHIPFCRKKCGYCSFYSDTYNPGIAAVYIDVLKKQIDQLDGKFKTIYIGGGTPSILSTNLLKKLFFSLKKNICSETEFTIEVNPESVNKSKLGLFLGSGINRLSIGVQSFNNNKLKALGRIHNAATSVQALNMAIAEGFKNISIDLIFGVSGETKNVWLQDLKTAVEFPLRHISCYNLIIEKGSLLYRQQGSKSDSCLNDELLAEKYKQAVSFLKKQGLARYEVSNFAILGSECRHNLNYWKNGSFYGIGASAVSYLKGIRKKRVCNIKAFTRGDKGCEYQEKLSPKKRAKETAALKIRTRQGIDFAWYKEKTGFDFLVIEKDALIYLSQNKMVVGTRKKKRMTEIRLNDKGFLYSDIASINFL
ncbi:MAG: radical SAM family heme chaperone HemW [Candidatus Gygaella obscura]|nr:radical SAM family heme chaperone HemW [Candidatus Gygaella obscura]